MTWQPIGTIPHYIPVEVYSAELATSQPFHTQSDGITICIYYPSIGSRPKKFIEHLSGLSLHYDWTHWRHIRPSPIYD